MDIESQSQSVPEPDEQETGTIQSPSRVVLPAVPPLLSEAFCLLNCFAPGLGTLCSSLSCCCARTRGMSKFEVVASVFVGLFIAFLQLLLTPVLLVGWVWSCFWGILITAQSDAYYKPRNEQNRARRILPRPLSAGPVHPEAPPPYTFYDDHYQRGRTPPPPYSPPTGPVTSPVTLQPATLPNSVAASNGHVNQGLELGPPGYPRVSSAPPARVEIINERGAQDRGVAVIGAPGEGVTFTRSSGQGGGSGMPNVG